MTRTQVETPAVGKPNLKAVGTSPSKRQTKKQQLINMLGGKGGADVAVISKRMGWQAHTARAALSGLRKVGYQIELEKAGKGKPARYRIISPPPIAEPIDAGGNSDAG